MGPLVGDGWSSLQPSRLVICSSLGLGHGLNAPPHLISHACHQSSVPPMSNPGPYFPFVTSSNRKMSTACMHYGEEHPLLQPPVRWQGTHYTPV